MINMTEQHFAVIIETTLESTIPELGLDNGIFRLITDGYQPATDKYEDLSPVGGTWYTDILDRDGIKTSTQSIDIITGGDFAWASSLQINLVNWNSLHRTLLTTDDLYIVGAPMQLYAIIDGVWYSRWKGTVGDYSFSDRLITINGKDKNNAENNILTNYAFGNSFIGYKEVEKDLNVVSFDQSVKCFAIDAEENRIVNNNFQVLENVFTEQIVNPALSNYEEDSLQHFNLANHFSDWKMSHTNNLNYNLYLNGQITTILKGMYIQFSTSDKYFVITEDPQIKYMGQWDNAGTLQEFYATIITLNELPEDLLDSTQLFGRQPNIVHIDALATEVITDSESTTGDKLMVSVYDKVFTFPKVGTNEFVTKDGKYIGITSDGDEVYINGSINDNGDLVVLSTIATKQYFPEEIKYYKLDTAAVNQLDSGTLKNIDKLPVSIWKPSQNLECNGKFKKTSFAPGHMFRMKFNENLDIKDKIPFLILNNLTGGGTYTWNDRFDTDEFNITWKSYAQYFDHDLDPADWNLDSVSILPPLISSDNEYLHNAMFPQYEVATYRIFTNPDYGDTVQLVSGSEFYLTNLNTIISKDKDSHYIWDAGEFSKTAELKTHIQSTGVTTTNLPIDNIKNTLHVGTNDYAISSFDNLNWFESTKYKYPQGRTSATSGVEIDKESMELIIVVKPFSDKNVKFIRNSLVGGATLKEYNINNNFSCSFGLNSIGVYTRADINGLETLKIKTVGTINTLPLLLGNLTDTVPVLANRNEWIVGADIIDNVNKFGVVTTLCKQSFVAGWTNRSGEVKFREFIEDTSNNWTHTDYDLIDKSISNFQLSGIDKCYNQFSINYNSNIESRQLTLSVGKVDADSFPPATYQDWQVPAKNEFINDTVYVYSYFDTNKNKWVFIVKIPEAFLTANPGFNVDLRNATIRGTQIPNNYDFEGSCYKRTATTTDVFYWFSPITNEIPQNSQQYPIQFNTIEYYLTINTDFSEYIGGITDYITAKGYWTTAHDSWLLNKRIRTAPNDRTNLEYAIDKNSFYGTTTYDPTIEYGQSYFRLFLEWTTRQKLMVNYNLPLNKDTVKLELLDTILFNDKIITPEIGEYGKGWITSIGLDPGKNIMKVGILFEPLFFKPAITPQCNNIIETGYNVNNIIETGSNPTNIIEGICGR